MISDDDLLRMARNERDASLGFDDIGGVLQQSRLTALKYSKREMDDLPARHGESEAVSPDVIDAIEQVLPDLLAVFVDEEIAAFIPQNPDDLDAAQQETDLVNQVVLRDNPGYTIFYTWIKDALLMKNGYVVAEWQDPPTPDDPEHFEDMTREEVVAAFQMFGPRLLNVTPELDDPDGLEFSFDIAPPPQDGKCVITNWPPEHVSVSADTVEIGDGTWVGLRSYIRRGRLLTQGYDAELVSRLPRHTITPSITALARDDAGQALQGLGRDDSGLDNMDTVEVTYHYIRVYDEASNSEKLFKLTTGGENTSILLKREEVNNVPVACLTPFRIPHAHYGESVADKMAPTQRIRSAIWRGALNSMYYAQTQRFAVQENALSDNTLPDLLNPAPGSPVRMADIGGIAPLQAGSLNYDPFAALEYAAVAAEKSTGILRSSMGLNPDTLHETSSGMLSMMAAGQRRVRSMAQTMAQTGVRSLFSIVHDLVRHHSTMPRLIHMRGSFTPVDPTTWGERDAMSLEIGVGANGRDHDIAMARQMAEWQGNAVKIQGGPAGPLTTPNMMLALTHYQAKLMGVRNSDRYFPAVGSWSPPPPAPPQPSPELLKVQGELQQRGNQQAIDAQHAQARLQIDHQDRQGRIAIEAQRQSDDAALRQREIDLKHQIAMLKLQITSEQRVGQVSAELDLKRQEIALQAQLDATELALNHHDAEANRTLDAHNAEQDRRHRLDTTVRPGGEPG